MTGVNRLLAASTAVAFALLAWVLWLDDDCSCPAVPPASSTPSEPQPSSSSSAIPWTPPASSLIPPASSSRPAEPEPASPVPASGGLTG